MKNVMNYGKAQGMTLVGRYLPKINPFQYMDAVRTLEEWEQVRSKYGATMIHRIDYPIGHAQVKKNATQGTNGLAESIPELIATVQAQSDVGVVLVVQTTFPTPPRYLYLGGFNILFRMGIDITIELVGKAFDGHELTQGWGYHERYSVNWDDLPFATSRADLARLSTSRALVTAEQYQGLRQARMQFLTKECHYLPNTVEANVPRSLILLSNDALRLLLDDVVMELCGRRALMEHDGLTMFGVQGNVVEYNDQIFIQPWEIFRPERWQ